MHVSNFFTIPNNIYIIWQFVFIHMHFLFCWHSIVRFLWHSFRYLSSYRVFHLKNNSKMYQTFLITSISNPVFYYCFYMYKIRAELFLVFLDLYIGVGDRGAGGAVAPPQSDKNLRNSGKMNFFWQDCMLKMAEMKILGTLDAEIFFTAQPWWAEIIKNINIHLKIHYFCHHEPLWIRAILGQPP